MTELVVEVMRRYKLIGPVWIALLLAAILIPDPVHAQDDTAWILAQINTLRASVGLPGYALNAQLSAAATQHSQYMAATCDVSHTESNGSQPADRARANGYTGGWISENIYGGAIARAVDAWQFWINSPVHYNGLVNPNTNEVGIGIADGQCGHYYTLVFGQGNGVAAPPPPEVAAAPPESGAEDDAAPAPAAPPPTRVPYVPPPPTRTPTTTIPTLTPSATWTITPTHTITPTGTQRPPTSTPIMLPTVPALGQITAIGLAASPSPTVIALAASSPLPVPTRTAIPVSEPQAAGGSRLTLRTLIPYALAGQIVLIGIVGFVYFRRSR